MASADGSIISVCYIVNYTPLLQSDFLRQFCINMLSHSRPLSLLSLTVAYFLATSLAAPGPSTKPTSNLQLNGVPGPYFDGVEGADRAEIAGIMATLILNNGNGNTDEDSSSSSNRDDAATKSKLWLFIVVNEYKDDRLIRQSECFRDVVDGMPELHVSQYSFGESAIKS